MSLVSHPVLAESAQLPEENNKTTHSDLWTSSITNIICMMYASESVAQ